MSLPVRKFTPPADLAKVANGRLPDELLVDAHLPGRKGARFHYRCARAWWAMADACLSATGVVLTVTGTFDAYRPYSVQDYGFLDRFDPCSLAVYLVTASPRRRKCKGGYWKLKAGRIPSACPGSSPHGLGCAGDAAEWRSNGGVRAVRNGPAWQWLIDNVVRFGFSWEYPDLGIDDPHLRYFAGDATPQAVLDYESGNPTAPVPTFDPENGHYGLWPLTVPKPRLGLNSKGDVVKYLQAVLNKAGANPPLKVDGGFGTVTRRAVGDFQRANGLSVDYWVGNQEVWPRIDAIAVA